MRDENKDIILLKMGEIVLKGHNRSTFEGALRRNIRYRLGKIGSFTVQSSQSTVYVTERQKAGQEAFSESAMDKAYQECRRIFGVVGLVRARACEKSMEDISRVALEVLGDKLRGAKTFKVEAKRSDKAFPFNSPAICRELGGVVLDAFPHLRVDVHHPEVLVMVEVRETAAYVHSGTQPGAGGIPVGTGGKAMLMLSGGIDSPVAGIMMSKRGLQLDAVHFHSYPYTSDRAKQKVVELAELMSCYSGDIRLFVVPFTKAQEAIRDHCTEDLFTLIMRRIMIQIAERLAKENGCKAMISGESLGQVASQTLEGLCVTDQATEMPIFRPCIGMDKEEIVVQARKYGTLEKSCEPYEDCCALFAPKHPQTKPKLDVVLEDEKTLPMAEIIEEALAGTEILVCKMQRNVL